MGNLKRRLMRAANVAAMAFVATLAVSDTARGVVFTSGAVGDMGSITFSGTVVTAISLDVLATADGTPPSAGGDLNLWTTGAMPASTVSMGNVNYACSAATTNTDCYVVTDAASNARYVATFTASLTFAGFPSMSLDIRRNAAGAGTFADEAGGGGIRAALLDTANWKLNATGTTLGTTNPGFNLLSAQPSGSSRLHQIAIRITNAHPAGAATSLVTYRTF